MIASIIIGLLVLLIAYWWANAGAWSSFLHMLCVIMAGVIAFALWEPVAYLILSGGMSNYALGVTLLSLFLVLLVVFRLAMDRLVPANLQLPPGGDALVGATFGIVSGVLTMGTFVIGCGFVQSTAQIGDVSGWLRRSDAPKAPNIGSDNAPLLHLVNITTNFYGYLSWGAFAPWGGGGTLQTHHPDLARSALSLYRDSYGGGTARTGLSPSSISKLSVFDVGSAQLDPGVGTRPAPAIAVAFTVDQDGYDGGGQQFVLSASQASLIGAGADGRAASSYPTTWVQSADNQPAVYYFNAPGNYATTKAGEGTGSFVLLFPKSDLMGQQPKFFQLKGVRFPISKVTAIADLTTLAGGGKPTPVIENTGITQYAEAIEVPDDQWALPVALNANARGGLVLDDKNYIIRGKEVFPRNASSNPSASLRIRGFAPIEGTRVVRLDASATARGARLWPDLNEWVREAGTSAQDSRIALVDGNGVRYYCIGYAEDDSTNITINASGGTALRLRDVPVQSLGNNMKLLLYFRVPAGVTIKYLALDGADGVHAVNTLDFPIVQKQ